METSNALLPMAYRPRERANFGAKQIYREDELNTELISTEEHTVEELVEWLCSNYAVGADVAQDDIERQLAEWREFGLIY